MARYTYGCRTTGKRRFAFSWEADWALDHIWKMALKGTNKSTKLPCRSYGPCEYCNGYHHTSKPLHIYEQEQYESGSLY